MEAARSMLETGLPGSYVKSIGWPFLIAIAFFVFGFKSSVVFYTSIFLGAATIFPVFFLAYIMSAKEKWSLFLTFLFSLFPLHILWSASGETNVAALFFVILTIFFYFLYYKNEKNSYSLFWLCLASASFAAQFRPEFYAFYPLFIFGYFLYKKPFFNFEKSDLKFILPLILLVALSLPNLFVVLNFQLSYNWLANESGGRITGNNWSIKNLIENTANYGPGLFKNELAILFLAIAGIGYSFFKKRKEALFVLVWLFSFWIIDFSAWLQTLGERTRFYISFYPGLTILALYGFLLFQDKINQLSIRNFYKKFLMSCLILSVLFFGALSVFICFKNY